ncbi:hypothetical protein [Acidovorax sp. KKS102]|uniref:hypothetical protein n=1 Tax=Acidovorax sp. KKS102 TaxID=358220 RepID=UPI0011D2459F|nr:hypothetical protein [Acidovorax sp. KKS102]
MDSVPVGTKLYTTPPAQAADSVTAPAYSIDADPQGIRARVAEAITGALAFGAQGANPPPTGHWLAPFWEMAREEASCNRPVSSDTLYLLRRLLSNQHTLTGSEFREELTKIVGEATQAADSVPVAPFDDPKVQAVYAILCSDVQPPEGEHWEGFAARRIVDAISADSVLEDADPIRALIAEHAAILDQNESAYFELCYHRATGWMAWITDKPLCMPPVVNPDRKVLAQGQGDTADEACRDAARKQGGA